MDTKQRDVLRWFADMGDIYVAHYLSPNRVDVDRMLRDSLYGLTCFLYNWAYERSGASKGYRIAAVKAVAAAWPDLGRVPDIYEELYHGKLNRQNNPALDPRLAVLSIPEIMHLVQYGEMAGAFDRLSVRGVGPKIRAFFLRDLVTMMRVEPILEAMSGGALYYCQPVDVWVKWTLEALDLSGSVKRAPESKAFEEREHYELASHLIAAAHEIGASPLRINQGIWMFASNVVADQFRLQALVRQGAPALEQELALIDGFLPN